MENEYEYVIQASHISKNYEETVGLEDVSFSISSKGVHGILGPKGAGKSTLMDLLAGCTEADAGAIFFEGSAFDTEARSSKARIGYVPAQPIFYEKMTASEILDFVGEARGVSADRRYRQIKEAVELVELEEIQNRLVAKLTKAERKRLALAAALLGNTELLLLDEPTFFESRENTVALLRMLGKHKTVLLASEDFVFVREVCEDVVLLSEGAVIAQDTFEGLETKLLRTRMMTVLTQGTSASLAQAMEGLDGVLHCTAEADKRAGAIRLCVEYRAEQDVRSAVSERLIELGAPILSMSNESVSLESVYASLVSISAQGRKNGKKEERI